MNNSNSRGPSSDRIEELAFAYCDGSLDAESLAELEALLQSGPEALHEYHRCLTLHARLSRLLGVDPSPPPRDEPRVQAHRGTKLIPLSIVGVSVLAIAATLLLMLQTPTSAPLVQPTNFAARVIDKIDSDWESERWGVASAVALDSGQVVNLSRGLMVVEFGDGAIVTLEGPSQFEVVSSSRGFLHAGSLTATVPERARGFTVGTPSCESIDLGTEFGLKVRPDGTAETHVFEGEVVLRQAQTENGSAPEDLHLTTQMAARVDGASLKLSELKARPKSFVRREVKGAASADEIVTVPNDRRLALWLDAGVGVQVDERDRVASWSDRLHGDNTARQDAWQVRSQRRPQWTADAINGHPAVRFGKATFMVTAPLATGDDVTTFVVFKPGRHDLPAGKSGMLVNFNGPPNIVLSRSPKNELMGRMYAGYEFGVSRHGSWLRTPGLVEGEACVAAYTYNATERYSALFANGELREQGPASEAARIESPKYLGRNRDPKDHFIGDIAEVLIFDSAFSDEQAAAVSRSLMKKYGVAAGTGD